MLFSPLLVKMVTVSTSTQKTLFNNTTFINENTEGFLEWEEQQEYGEGLRVSVKEVRTCDYLAGPTIMSCREWL